MSKQLKKQSLRIASEEESGWFFSLVVNGEIVTLCVTDVFV
jgi:hypothetical protein